MVVVVVVVVGCWYCGAGEAPMLWCLWNSSGVMVVAVMVLTVVSVHSSIYIEVDVVVVARCCI